MSICSLDLFIKLAAGTLERTRELRGDVIASAFSQQEGSHAEQHCHCPHNVTYTVMCSSATNQREGVVSLLRLELEQQNNNDQDVLVKPKKHVRFSVVETREYALVVGDHPLCPDGLALSLDWRYSPETTVKNVLDAQEKKGCGEPKRLGYSERRLRLKQASNEKEEIERIEECKRLDQTELPQFVSRYAFAALEPQ